jgi:hypothetical protein
MTACNPFKDCGDTPNLKTQNVSQPKFLIPILALIVTQALKAQENTGGGLFLGSVGNTLRLWSPGVQHSAFEATFVGSHEYGYRSEYPGFYVYHSSNSIREGIDYQVRDGVMWLPNFDASISLNGYGIEIGAAVFKLSDIPDLSFQKLIISPYASYGGLTPSIVSLFAFHSDGAIRPNSFTQWGSPNSTPAFGDFGWYLPIDNGAGYLGDIYVDITADLRAARSNGWEYVTIAMKPAFDTGILIRAPQIVSANFNVTATTIPESNNSPVLVLTAALFMAATRTGRIMKSAPKNAATEGPIK